MYRGHFLVLLSILAIASIVCAKTGYGPGEQDWGYVDVRTGAHMFYWLYYTTASVTNYTERPLAIWLQGGNGASSTGYGNFEELGPLDLYGNYRSWTWVKDMNVLFIDSPVGSGFSYVDDWDQLSESYTQVSLDLLEFIKFFYDRHPEFENVPLHIFSQGNGGQTVPEFALQLYYAIKRDEIKCNLKSVVLGNPWTSPIDSVMAWAPLLLNMGIVDKDGFNNIMDSANTTLKFVKEENWIMATFYWVLTQEAIKNQSRGVDFYNIVKPTTGDASMNKLNRSINSQDVVYETGVTYDVNENRKLMLKNLMNGAVSKALGIPDNVQWGSQTHMTFLSLINDFMRPAVQTVRDLLDKTDLKVGVFSGQLDLICATAGTVNWIEKMQWSYRDKYVKAPRVGIYIDQILEGYEKSAGNFTMFWVNRAGHMVPADNPAVMSYILKKFTNYGLKVK